MKTMNSARRNDNSRPGLARRGRLPCRLTCFTATLTLLLTAPPVSADLIFLEFGGQVVVEAEHFSSRVPSPVQRWLVVPDESPGLGFANARGGYLQVLPHVGGFHGDPFQTPYVDYRLRISTAGRYHLYLRWTGLDPQSDSVYARVLELSDGPGGAVADWYGFTKFPFANGDFATIPWQGEAGFESTPGLLGMGVDAVWVIPAAGDYTLRFSMREDGAALDTFVFQLATLNPPTGIGPPESASIESTAVPEPSAGALLVLGTLGLLSHGWRRRAQNTSASPARRRGRTVTLRVEELEGRVLLDTSALWGVAGELWSPQSRLPDFSFAGYHAGEAPIPDVPVVANVRDFGATGDGVTDDGQAFAEAIEAASGRGAVFVPAGHYVIRRYLSIYDSNLVLRGEGSGLTTLVFPDPLATMRGPGNAPTGTPFYAWYGGVVWVQGRQDGRFLADVTAGALRGDNRLTLSTTAGITVGQMVELFQTDPSATDHSLGSRLHADQPLTPDPLATTTPYTDRFVSRVTAIEGNTITLERPLRIDVELRWRPQISSYQPTIEEVGVEGLTFEFPAVPYPGHEVELGYNGIQIQNAANCWIRDVTFVNADSGIFLDGTRFTTVQDVSYTAYAERATFVTAFGPSNGHHGIVARSSWDNLITGFNIAVPYVHDLTVSSDASGNVFERGRGANLTLDHHGRAPFENLYTEVDVGLGTRTWASGSGNPGEGNSGARQTFWNIQAATPQHWPGGYPYAMRPPDQLNFVGITTNDATVMTPAGRWWEAIPPAALTPPNLYEAQLARRLGWLPAPWQAQDIGGPGLPGGAYATTAFFVSGSGAGVGDAADSFHFVYRPLTGDGWILARVATVQADAPPGALAGVMIRSGSEADAAFAGVFVTPGDGASFRWRTEPGGTGAETTTERVLLPSWLYLERRGDGFSAYGSIDGTVWYLLGSVTIPMADTAARSAATSTKTASAAGGTRISPPPPKRAGCASRAPRPK
jgi:hypothetical protein